MSRTFVTSDMHFGHKNIIEYEKRPFASLPEMDNAIIKIWNDNINKNDKVFVLGDVSFYDKEKTKKIISQLHGNKHLIMGNHDRGRSVSWWQEVDFEQVSAYPIIINEFVILSHEPLYLNASMPYINIHGHTHSNNMMSSGAFQRYFNVCIDANGFEPILLEDILKRSRDVAKSEANNGSKNMSNDN